MQTPGPTSLKLPPLIWSKAAYLDGSEAGILETSRQAPDEIIVVQLGNAESLDLGTITLWVDAGNNLEQATVSRKSAYRAKHLGLTQHHASKQAAPWEVDVYLIRDTVQLLGQVLDGGLHKHRVRQAALRGFPGCLHRRLLERLDVCVDPDKELVRMLSRLRRHKASVARSQIDHDPAAGILE